ncbi:MAG: YggS family pyridoxal phosphate-dependent enzyme [Sphingobacteriales bacterium]|nr:YggS family pyridoxal phosphate-dependent enzyme [Sphingobacteriales bacterium]
MAVHKEAYQNIRAELEAKAVTLVAVSKTKPAADILELYELGQRDFGENYVQELVEKAEQLPKDIRWHFIGHLQSNKVKFIAPFVHLVHGVDSWKLLLEINKQGGKHERVIDCLLQVYIAREETKFGLDEEELSRLLKQVPEYSQQNPLNHVRIRGLMGMASFSTDMQLVREEFRNLKRMFDKQAGASAPVAQFDTLSMGMSSDYRVAVEEGSTLVRIGSLLFGERTKPA